MIWARILISGTGLGMKTVATHRIRLKLKPIIGIVGKYTRSDVDFIDIFNLLFGVLKFKVTTG